MASQGPACIDRAANWGDVYTFIALDDPATEEFTVATVKTWMNGAFSDFETGSFEDNGSNAYTCRGNCSEDNMSGSGSSCETFTAGVDFTAYTVQNAEYAGCYRGSGPGAIEYATSGGSGMGYNYGDEIEDDEQNTYTIDSGGNNILSLLIEGAAAGGALATTKFMHMQRMSRI